MDFCRKCWEPEALVSHGLRLGHEIHEVGADEKPPGKATPFFSLSLSLSRMVFMWKEPWTATSSKSDWISFEETVPMRQSVRLLRATPFNTILDICITPAPGQG